MVHSALDVRTGTCSKEEKETDQSAILEEGTDLEMIYGRVLDVAW